VRLHRNAKTTFDDTRARPLSSRQPPMADTISYEPRRMPGASDMGCQGTGISELVSYRAVSRRTSFGFLSARNPTNLGCRRCPWSVHSTKEISATSFVCPLEDLHILGRDPHPTGQSCRWADRRTGTTKICSRRRRVRSCAGTNQLQRLTWQLLLQILCLSLITNSPGTGTRMTACQ
jgi:hypothetical protein